MSHQGQTVPTEPAPHHQDLKVVLHWLLAYADFSAVSFRDTCTWTPRGLTAAALLWAWSGEVTLTERFDAARKIAIRALGLGELTAKTYQAFLKMLRAWTATLAVALVVALRRRMRDDLADRFLVGGYAVFGVDGSRLELPRTAANEACCAPAPRRRSKAGRAAKRRARPSTRADAARAKK